MSENQLKKSQSNVASPHPIRRGMGRYTKCSSYGSITANGTIIVQIFGCKTKKSEKCVQTWFNQGNNEMID